MFADGFESGDLTRWSGATGLTAQQVTVHTGAWAGRATSTGAPAYAWRTFTGQSELWARTAFNVESRSAGAWFLSLRKSGGAAILMVGVNAAGKLIARNVTTGTTYPSSVVVAGGWHALEVHARTGGGGLFEVTLDGTIVTELSRSSSFGTGLIGRLTIGDTSSGRTFRVAFDDVSIATDPGEPSDDAARVGAWTEPFEIGVVGVHAAVLRTGKVLLFYRTEQSVATARLLDPTTRAVTDVSPPVSFQHNMFCSAHTLTRDGSVFVVGGLEWGAAGIGYGEDRSAFFDPISESWTVGPAMSASRWYPTMASLPNGDQLVIAGDESPGVRVGIMERFDIGERSFSTMPPSATLQMNSYPRMFALPDGRFARVGQERQARFFDPQTSVWTAGPSMTFGARQRGSAVLLPGLDRILAIGGATGTATATTATAEVLDFGAPQQTWRRVGSMVKARRNFNAVLLPDGDVLAVGGNAGTTNYDLPVRAAEMYDTEAETWESMAEQSAPRAYHSTAVLLPDGRVLSAGQTSGTMQTTAEIYSPPYLFAGPRPVIEGAPAQIAYGTTFTVNTAQRSSIESVALIRGDSVTHGVNFDQRLVDLTFEMDAGALRLRAPSSGREAPPGWYMLFLVNDGGVPSVAEWVHVS